MTAEHQRIFDNLPKKVPLEQWGPYLSERQWGTVREDYGPLGDAWNYFPFDQSHYRAYLWGEDGIAGISDLFQNLCFAITLWNGKDPILKERLFGLGNTGGNHGEDVKELYYYLDNIPTHYYMQYLYKYPQREFPYEDIKRENRQRSKNELEYEILDTGVFDNNQYFDVTVTYAKQDSQDIFIKINILNRYTESAGITVLPTLWYYNRMSNTRLAEQPIIRDYNKTTVKATHQRLGTYYLYFPKTRATFYTNNVTNTEKVSGTPNETPFVKDAFNDAIVKNKNAKSLRVSTSGTKFAPIYDLTIGGGESVDLYLRLTNKELANGFEEGFENIFTARKAEADEFYKTILPANISEDLYTIQRQALAGLLWSKQFYHYDVERWLSTSDGITPVNTGKLTGRNHEWKHLKNQNIIFNKTQDKLMINADHEKIEQVVINIINNAIKYSREPGDIIVNLMKLKGYIKVDIEDKGIGIPKKDFKNIFLRFFRVRGSASSFSGSGVGLYISSEIIKNHKGKIWVESKIGKGSVFHFTLPAIKK